MKYFALRYKYPNDKKVVATNNFTFANDRFFSDATFAIVKKGFLFKNGRHEPKLIQYKERLETNNMAFKSSFFNIETGKVVTVDNAPLRILGFLLQICSMLS